MRASRLPVRAMAQYNKPRINAAAKSSALRRRLDACRIDLDAPSRHLAVAAIDREHAGIVTSCVRPVARIRDQPETLGLEERFSIGEEGELRSGHASTQNCNLARSQALKRETIDLSQCPPFGFSLNHQVMIPLDEPAQDKKAPKPKPSRSQEAALRIIEEYANDLREIIKKLRHLLN
jgi:hypothetical protein